MLLNEVVNKLSFICGDQYVITDAETLHDYEHDQTLGLNYKFEILVKPASAHEISGILNICNEFNLPVTPRGGGSGVTGGALPLHGGVVLSLERLNSIITINQVDGYVIAESGVITADLCDAVEQHNLYFPVAPSSATYSFVGGNVAENAGSVNSSKYGTTARYILNLEVVLPNGAIIWTGANVSKNSTGLNLTQLFAGSEGILGIITKVVYKLLPKPNHQALLLAAFENLEDAFNAVIAIKRSSLSPCAVELVCNNALFVTAEYLGGTFPLVREGINAHLLIDFKETQAQYLDDAIEEAYLIVEKFTKENILVATTAAEKEKLWKLRMSIGAALTANNKIYRDIDICMPLSALYNYVQKVEAICRQYQVPVACFGHVFDGNLHTMLTVTENVVKAEHVDKAVNEIYEYAILNGGVISGEHGIGLLQKQFMAKQFTEAHLKLMQNIKNVFDPAGILNPGKVV
jgi:glycolate oxidase